MQKKNDRRNILFIVDGSITNPILQSQGLPFLYNLNSLSFSVNVLSFENPKWSGGKISEIEKIKSHFDDRIHFYPLEISKKGLLPSWFYTSSIGVKTAKILVKKNDVKLLHARSFLPAFISIIIKIFFIPSIKVLYDCRGVFIDEQIVKGKIRRNSLKEIILRLFEKVIIHKSSFIVLVSEQFKLYYAKLYGKKILKKTLVINNKTLNRGISKEHFLNFRSKNKIIGVYSGSAADWQNINQLFELFKFCVDSFSDILFKIITYNKKEFSELLSKYPELKDKVELNFKDPDEVFDTLKMCNFGILLRDNNLINNVASPLKFAEYLAAGLPVLISEGVGDTEKIIKNNKIGAVIYDNDYKTAISEIKNLLFDEKVIDRCLMIASKEFDIRDSFLQYENIYNKILE